MSPFRILAVYAHPDDEQGITGYLRHCVGKGDYSGLVCATRGEVGEISDAALATPETLGAVREQELVDAANVVGIHEVFFLDFRDSGMKGSPSNSDPRAFINADPHEATGRIVRIMRAFKPDVVVTFDRTGVYGHPDHLAAHRWTTDAFRAATDVARYPVESYGGVFQPQRLYYTGAARAILLMFDAMLRDMERPSIFQGVDVNTMGIPDEEITHRINVSPYVDLKRDSFMKHRTQIQPNGAFEVIGEDQWKEFRATEVYAFAEGVPLPTDHNGQDLFIGLTPAAERP
ncbi:MAG TPA: PIG-L family deacetylase [Aggregatilineales bacterium]|nr:PIG-L family deacetylase [Anaerolineales bacterium]HRE48217.1 PIG-L family deacetylase [Aggregatilineales bacterium]